MSKSHVFGLVSLLSCLMNHLHPCICTLYWSFSFSFFWYRIMEWHFVAQDDVVVLIVFEFLLSSGPARQAWAVIHLRKHVNQLAWDYWELAQCKLQYSLKMIFVHCFTIVIYLCVVKVKLWNFWTWTLLETQFLFH